MAGVYRGVSGAVVGTALTLLLMPASAGATFPGDNGRIAFQNDTLGGIYTIDEDGSDRTKLADGFEPSWSASGRRIVFVKETGPLEDTEVFTMKANGKDKHRVTHDNVYEWEPVYSPDAKQLAYRTGKFRSAGGKLYVSNADGSHRKQFADGQNPDWSVGVDGAKDGLIAYSGESTDPCFTELELFTVKPNGHGTTLLPFGCNTATMPSWSPDGGQLGFSSYPPAGNSDIYIGTEDGETKLTDLGPHDDGPAWSPDETKVAFGDRDNGLYIVAVAAPLTEVAVPNTVEVDGAQPAWQPQ